MLGRFSNQFTRRVLNKVQKRHFGEIEASPEEAAQRGKFWRNVSLISLAPSTALFLYIQYFEEEEEEIELPNMPYKNMVIKRFPWVEGEKSLFLQLKERHHAKHGHHDDDDH